MRHYRSIDRRARGGVLALAVLVLAACGSSNTTTREEEEPAVARFTRPELRFVQLTADSHAGFLVTATGLFLFVPKIQAGGVSSDDVQKLIDSAYATLEVWDGFESPSERLAPAVDAWFRVLDEEWDFVSAWVDIANEPDSQPTFRACLKQLASAGNAWTEYEQAVLAAAEPVPEGRERVQTIFNSVESSVQELVDEFGS